MAAWSEQKNELVLKECLKPAHVEFCELLETQHAASEDE
jgi:hypothetical protein